VARGRINRKCEAKKTWKLMNRKLGELGARSMRDANGAATALLTVGPEHALWTDGSPTAALLGRKLKLEDWPNEGV